MLETICVKNLTILKAGNICFIKKLLAVLALANSNNL